MKNAFTEPISAQYATIFPNQEFFQKADTTTLIYL